YAGMHNEEIWVRVQSDSDPSLFSVTSFKLIRDKAPVINPSLTPYVICLDSVGQSQGNFILKSKDNEVKSSVGGLIVEYYETAQDALLGDPSKALSKDGYMSTEKEIHIRLYSPLTGCYSVGTLLLKFNPPIVLGGLQKYILCSDSGYAQFNLEQIASEKIGVNSSWHYGFYRTAMDAENQINKLTSLTYTNGSPGGESIFIRVENEVGCVLIQVIELTVGHSPLTKEPSDFVQCDINGNGVADFDLTVKEAEVLNGIDPSDVLVSYYTDYTKAVEGNASGAIVDAAHHSSLTGKYIYVRVEDKITGCASIEQLRLQIIALPVINGSIADYVVCDSKTNTGIAQFKLSDKRSEISTQSNVSITFYASQSDAQAKSNALNDTAYSNTTANRQEVFVRVEDISTGCYTLTSFFLVVNQYPVYDVSSGSQMVACTSSANGQGVFNLVGFAMEHTPGYKDYEFTFFETEANALANKSNIKDPETYSNLTVKTGKVWVRLQNKLTGCVGIYEITLRTEQAPVVSDKLPGIELCDYYGDHYDYSVEVDLTVNEAAISKGIASGHQWEVEYYRTESNAQQGVNRIMNPELYHNSLNQETIWVKLVDLTTGCEAYGSFSLTVNIPLRLLEPLDLIHCSDLSIGQNKAVFDLTTYAVAIVGGTPVFGTRYSYYESESDALADTNAIAESDLTRYINKTPAQSIWIVVENEQGCRSMVIQNLIVDAMPEPNTRPSALETCELEFGKAEGIFVLQDALADIVQGDSQLEVEFYPTRSAAESGTTDPLDAEGEHNSSSGKVYARVINKHSVHDPQCFVIVELDLIVHAKPYIEVTPLLKCLDVAVEFYPFNLEEKNAEILDGRPASDYRITYHKAELDAVENKLPLAYEYTNSKPFEEELWIRLEERSTGCFHVSKLLLKIEEKVEAFP
ncbi:hypothetical protein, partial [Myroides indicus]|uniref:hypothetical protein n=1 Tax=Myroides indicus TaxID=1323422 RepID=UPI001414F391